MAIENPSTEQKPVLFQLVYDPVKGATYTTLQGDFPIAALINGLWMALLLYGQQQLAAAFGMMQGQAQKSIVAPDGRPLPKLKH